MTLIRWAVRLFCLAGAVVLILFSVVQIQQRMLRWRAERLSADMQKIRLYQSTWADAQQLMKRWGGQGHYEGTCTAESCTYQIQIADLSFYSPHIARHVWVDWLLRHDRYNLYPWLGGRGAGYQASFTVRNGTIWREGAAIAVAVTSRKKRTDDDYDRTLLVSAQTRQRLHPTLEDWFSVMGSDEQLAQHPYYKVGRPGGCKPNCQMASVSFSPRTPPAEIERLTSYDFSCLTRPHPCTEIEEVLAAAKEWHLYKEDESTPALPKPGPSLKIPCDIPVWALARDARYVLAVEAVATGKTDTAMVRVVASLKEPTPWPIGAMANVYLFTGNKHSLPPQRAEHRIARRRFIVFPIGNDRRDQLVTKDSPIMLSRCGVQEDNPEIQREIQKGLAQNDTLNP